MIAAPLPAELARVPELPALTDWHSSADRDRLLLEYELWGQACRAQVIGLTALHE